MKFKILKLLFHILPLQILYLQFRLFLTEFTLPSLKILQKIDMKWKYVGFFFSNSYSFLFFYFFYFSMCKTFFANYFAIFL